MVLMEKPQFSINPLSSMEEWGYLYQYS